MNFNKPLDLKTMKVGQHIRNNETGEIFVIKKIVDREKGKVVLEPIQPLVYHPDKKRWGFI